jgi:hypothetical protein
MMPHALAIIAIIARNKMPPSKLPIPDLVASFPKSSTQTIMISRITIIDFASLFY